MIEKLEIKINKIKKKINSKVLGVVIFMIFGAFIIFSLQMSNSFKRQKQQAQDMYNKAMYEIIGYVKNVEAELSKVQITSTNKLTITTLASIWRQSTLAKENLESLPVEQKSMANASKYLSQVGDYSYVLMKKVISNYNISKEEYEDIKKMHDESVELTEVISDIYYDLNNGRIKWDELKKLGNEKLNEVEVLESVSNIDKIGKTFKEYEGLIYDGAFSDHLLSNNPRYIENEKEVSIEDAKVYIENIFKSQNIEKLEFVSESNGKIDLYTFNLKLKENEKNTSINITKKGCKMYLMIGDRKVAKEEISMEDAKKSAKEFLEKIGIINVEDTYYIKSENMAVINYAAKQGNTIIYSDLIKVKIALDTGEVCSVESQGYIFNHIKREITPKISQKEAKSILNKNIEVLSEGLALIPTESKSEVLTYEFKGKIEEKEFLVYINADTKQEEKILLILNTPGGTLTI